MKLLDKSFLTLQFRNQIYEKNGSEFQRFFEKIIEKVYPDFKRIKPYGRDGDAGNDGYCKSRGEYYQIYAPDQPIIKEAEAARKLKRDFLKLKKSWDEISKIQKYYFVYNNKYTGSTLDIEEAISELEKENPGIQFDTFLTKDLEELFFTLDVTDILDLGFNVSLTEAVANAYKYLDKVEIELDRENAQFAYKILENIRDIISTLGNDLLELEYKILECRCLQKLERIDEAKSKYENLVGRFPNDPRALLYLSDIYLLNDDFEKNKELLDQVEKIDANYWLLKLEKLVRKYYLDEKVDITNIDEQNFPCGSRIKANFYRLYSVFLEKSGNTMMAYSFIEKAINLNPDRLINYTNKLSIIERRIVSRQGCPNQQELQTFLRKVEEIEEKFSGRGPRIKAMLNMKKLNIFHLQENYHDFEILSQETFELLLSCFFNNQIDQMLMGLLTFIRLSDKDFGKLLNYLEGKEISDELAKVLIVQFNIRNNLINIGKKFFIEINKQKYVDFINDVESKNYDNILSFLKDDIQFAVCFADTLKNLPDLRKIIIENLPDDKNIQKDKLMFLLYYDECNFDEAFKIVQNIDLSKLNYFECIPILEVVRRKQAWDFEVIVIQKLLEYERDNKVTCSLKLHLFHANFQLQRYPEAIKIGREILEKEFSQDTFDLKNKEILLARTIYAYLIRREYDQAKQLLNMYPLSNPTFEFKITIEAETYLANNEPEKALNSVIEGVKIKKLLSTEEYTNLYHLIAIKIGNSLSLKLESWDKINENSFVKLKNQDKWYFIGNDNELDAVKIAKEHDKYSLFINKNLNDKITFESEYSSKRHEETIEKIFLIEQYVLWQVIQNFQKLSHDDILDDVQMIEVPKKEGTIDTKYLLAFLENLHKKTEPFFEIYCKKNIPLAVLSVSEGSVTNAIGRIQHENKGYVNFSTGIIEEIETQKRTAKNVIDINSPFYLDGTSALILSEFNLLKKIYIYLPNLKVPQSVIILLNNIAEELRYKPGQVGYMRYTQDKISFISVEKGKRDPIQSNITESIDLLESNPKNISVISLANKFDCFSEKRIPAELSDACILAQKENIPILTEDFLLLKLNEIETKKKAPEYFSSIILLRILYEQKKISFEEYLDFFGYLSSYRFRFLSFSHDDIIKAVFGDTKIKTVKPENIRKLNFPLTLSEEYGVSFRTAFVVIVRFLVYILTNNAILPETAEKLFIEIIETFPTRIDKKDLGQMLLNRCEQVIEQSTSKFVITPKDKMAQEKVEKLLQIANIYNFSTQLWTPNKE